MDLNLESLVDTYPVLHVLKNIFLYAILPLLIGIMCNKLDKKFSFKSLIKYSILCVVAIGAVTIFLVFKSYVVIIGLIVFVLLFFTKGNDNPIIMIICFNLVLIQFLTISLRVLEISEVIVIFLPLFIILGVVCLNYFTLHRFIDSVTKSISSSTNAIEQLATIQKINVERDIGIRDIIEQIIDLLESISSMSIDTLKEIGKKLAETEFEHSKKIEELDKDIDFLIGLLKSLKK